LCKCILSYLFIRANEVHYFFDGGSREKLAVSMAAGLRLLENRPLTDPPGEILLSQYALRLE